MSFDPPSQSEIIMWAIEPVLERLDTIIALLERIASRVNPADVAKVTIG